MPKPRLLILMAMAALSPLGGAWTFTGSHSVSAAQGQEPEILLKGGHVIDPRNGIDAVMDLAIANGRILRVARDIPAVGARRVVDATGLYVTPGLVDLHAHVFLDAQRAIKPDGYTFRAGVTTVVDAGTSGWRNFPRLKEQAVDRSRTRVLAFLSIVGEGSAYPTESRILTQNVADMDPVLTAFRIAEYPGVLVGVKVQHYMGPDFGPVDRALDAARRAKVPVMVDFGEHDPPLSLETLLLEKLRPGDMLSHTFAELRLREAVVGDDGRVRPFVLAAQKRGVLFNVGHGGGSFVWRQVLRSIEQGFLPDIIDTDLHGGSMNAGMKDMANLVSKFLNVGMSLQEVFLRATWNPARAIGREDLGHLSEGAVADVAVFRLREGDFGFVDSTGAVLKGRRKLEAELTLRDGRVVWDLNGLAAPLVDGKRDPAISASGRLQH